MAAIHMGQTEVADKLIAAGAKLDLQDKVRESGAWHLESVGAL